MEDIIYKDDMDFMVGILNSGGIILYPTDTIWGIGCNALDEIAIRKVYKIKRRDLSKPMIILVDSISMLKEYVNQVHPRIETLLSYHTRPLTIIYDSPGALPNILISEHQTVAVRITQDPFCKRLIKKLQKPLVSTSANLAGHVPPGYFGEISSEVLEHMDYVVKHRQEDRSLNKPSVIASYDKRGDLDFLRT